MAAEHASRIVSDDLDRLTLDYWPYVGWRAHPLTSQTLNVGEDGNRVTPGAACTGDAFDVFVFGGSVVFGYGIADAETILAVLQRRLAERLRRPVCVRNLGQFSWASTEETVALLRELQEGRVPDLATFLNGFNDVNLRGDDGIGGRTADWTTTAVPCGSARRRTKDGWRRQKWRGARISISSSGGCGSGGARHGPRPFRHRPNAPFC